MRVCFIARIDHGEAERFEFFKNDFIHYPLEDHYAYCLD